MNTTDRSTVATIILNWNGRPYLEACLSALMAQTYPIARVMLVDNDSSDDSLPCLLYTSRCV